MASIIETRNLHKLYRVGDSFVHALNNVNLSIEQGAFVAIAGTSGSGKSTLLNLLAGLENVTEGEIVIDGMHIETMNESELVRFRRENVGFVFQSFNLIPTMTAAENVALPLEFRGENRAERLEKAEHMLDVVGILSHKSHKPLQMSGGQQQRVGIARALVVDPAIIFADEPTGNLDTHNSAEIIEMLKTVVREQKQTIVMVTHDEKMAKEADYIIKLSDGKVVV